jgi:hypothetical protein
MDKKRAQKQSSLITSQKTLKAMNVVLTKTLSLKVEPFPISSALLLMTIM